LWLNVFAGGLAGLSRRIFWIKLRPPPGSLSGQQRHSFCIAAPNADATPIKTHDGKLPGAHPVLDCPLCFARHRCNFGHSQHFASPFVKVGGHEKPPSRLICRFPIVPNDRLMRLQTAERTSE
jgi:hypothetical protein